MKEKWQGFYDRNYSRVGIAALLLATYAAAPQVFKETDLDPFNWASDSDDSQIDVGREQITLTGSGSETLVEPGTTIDCTDPEAFNDELVSRLCKEAALHTELIIPVLNEKGHYDYANGVYDLESYESNGLWFRRAIKSLEANGDERAEKLKSLYRMYMEIHDGREFLRDGVEFNPKAGDVFTIEDFDLENYGIYLRKLSSIEPNKHTDNSLVYDGMKVEILRRVFVTENGEEEDMVKVRVIDGRPTLDGLSRVAGINEEGYIPTFWLGRKIEPEVQE